MDSPQTEGDATSGNGMSGGIGPTGWRVWSLEPVLILGGFVSMVLAVLIRVTADPAFSVALAVVLAPGILFTALLFWRPRPWIYPIAGVADCLLGIIALPIGLVGALGNPLIGPLYSSVVLATLSILLALPAGILGYLQGRKILRQRTLAEGIYGLHGFAAIALVAGSIGGIPAGGPSCQKLFGPPSLTRAGFSIPPPADAFLFFGDSPVHPSV